MYQKITSSSLFLQEIEMDTKQYFFDSLPIHPKPEYFESFTSYLMRIAEANSITNAGGLTSIYSFRGKGIKLKDNTPLSFGIFPMATACSIDALLTTTFYHLNRKFGRSTSIRFLSREIAQDLRYCPYCLVDRPYYLLTWRFLLVQMCPEHRCRLLNECKHCGSSIPIFKFPCKIGICPTCLGNLRTCPTESITEEDYIENLSNIRDLEFLLSPQPWELSAQNVTEWVGQYFTTLRREKGLTGAQVAQSIGTTPPSITNLERGYSGAPPPLYCYFNYAALLGTTLEIAFKGAIEKQLRDDRSRYQKRLLTEEDIVKMVQQAIEQLEAIGQPPTQNSICKITHMDSRSFRKYPKIKPLLKKAALDVANYHKLQQESKADQMCEKIQQAVKQLQIMKCPITERSISKLIGIPQVTLSRLKVFVNVRMLLEDHIHQYHIQQKEQAQRYENDLKVKVEEAIEQLRSLGKLVSWTAVSQAVGVTPLKLRRYIQIKELLDKYLSSTSTLAFSEEDLIIKVESAIQQLKDEGKPVTQKAIGARVGICSSGFQKYPRVKALLQQHASWYHYYRRLQDRELEKEQDIVIKVNSVIKELESLASLTDQKSMEELLGTKPYTLKGRSQAKALLEQFEERYHHYLSAQIELREEALLAKVSTVAVQLETLGESITPSTISKVLEVPSRVLYSYPKVIASIWGQMNMESQRRAIEEQEREDALVSKALDAIEYLKQQGERISIEAIARTMQLRPESLRRYHKVNNIITQYFNV